MKNKFEKFLDFLLHVAFFCLCPLSAVLSFVNIFQAIYTILLASLIKFILVFDERK